MNGRALNATGAVSESRDGAAREPRALGGRWSSASVRCPACGLVLTPRVTALVPHHCPRCLVRRKLTVELEPHERLKTTPQTA
jgi:phage FluMu protein Com